MKGQEFLRRHLFIKIVKQFLGKYLAALCGLCFRHAKLSLGLLSLSFVLGSLYGAYNLKLRLAWTYLFEADDPVVVEFERSRELFPYPGDIAVLVDLGSSEQREAYLNLLAEEMAKEPEHYHHVFYRLDLSRVSTRALYFLGPELLDSLGETLTDRDKVSRSALVSEPAVKLQLKLLEDLKSALLSRGRSTLVPIWRVFADDRGGRITETLFKLLNGEQYVYATLAQNRVHVLVFKGGTRGTALAASRGEEVERVRALLKRLKPASYGLRVRLTGLPVMLFDERTTCAQDSLRSGVLSLVLIAVVFFVGFGGFRKPLFSLMGLLCGLGWTAAYSALVVGHLNFITVTMVSMLMGLGIDFGIHFLFRFQEEILSGTSPDLAVDKTVKTTGVDTFVGAAATSASFLALTATNFRGVSDLGLLASGGVLLCFFSTIMTLSSLLRLWPGEAEAKRSVLDRLAQFERRLLEQCEAVAALAFLAILGALFWASRVGFSYDLLAIQAQELASVQTEKEMLREYNTTVLSGAVLVKGAEEARRVAAELLDLETVSQVGTITDLLPTVSPTKRASVSRVVEAARPLQVPSPIALDRARDLLSLQQRLKEIEERSTDLPKDPTVVAAVDEVKMVVDDMPPGPLQDGLKSFQRSILKDFTKLLVLLQSQESEPLRLEDLPEDIRIRYVNDEGWFLLSVQPGVNIWKRDNLQRFLAQVEGKGVSLVGHPVVQSHILQSFDQAFKVTPLYTLLGVLSVMLLYLRRPGQVLLSSLPTALGVLIIFSVMGLFGLDFNVVNFVALPISVGIGAVYGVHAIHRMQEMGHESLLSTSTGYGILLSGLTTIAGFASLMTASHRGLSSFGFVISVGVVANLVVSLIVLPAIFRLKRLRKHEGS